MPKSEQIKGLLVRVQLEPKKDEIKFGHEHFIPIKRSNGSGSSTSNKKQHNILGYEISSSTEGGFSSATSSNGSYGASPPPTSLGHAVPALPLVPPNMCPGSPRNLRAQSVALHRSAIISAGHSNEPITFQNHQKMQKSSSEMSVKQYERHSSHRTMHRSSTTNNFSDKNEFWLRVVPSCKIRPRDCDEVPEEFKRAGIGLCFGGEHYFCFVYLHYNLLEKSDICSCHISKVLGL